MLAGSTSGSETSIVSEGSCKTGIAAIELVSGGSWMKHEITSQVNWMIFLGI